MPLHVFNPLVKEVPALEANMIPLLEALKSVEAEKELLSLLQTQQLLLNQNNIKSKFLKIKLFNV